ncbi:MAG: hypothetical protein ACYTG7_21930 [Planctomycetota bacterium]
MKSPPMQARWVLLLGVAVLGILSGQSAAQQAEGPEIDAWLESARIELGGEAVLVVEVSGPEAADCDIHNVSEIAGIEVRRIEGPRNFQRVGQEGSGRSESIPILAAQFRVTLLPLRPGTFDIPPVELVIGAGRRFLSPALILNVTEPVQTDHGVSLQVEVKDRQVFINQPLEISLLLRMPKERLHEIEQNGRDEVLSLPWLEDEPYFPLIDVAWTDMNVVKRSIPILGKETGIPFMVETLAESYDLVAIISFLPLQAGSFEFPALIYSVQMPEEEPIFCKSEPLSIEVKLLPEQGKPESFKNAVGRFRWESYLDSHRVKMGDSVEWTVLIQGEGNLEHLELPAFSELEEDFRIYDIEERKEHGKVWKTFHLAPRRMPVTTLPPLSFTYFDPEEVKYVILTSPAEAIQVYPGEERAIGAPPVRNGADIREDIHTIIQDWQGPGWLARARWPSIVLLGLSFILFIGSWAGARKRNKMEAAAAALRKQKTFMELRSACEVASSAEFLARAFGKFFSKAFGLGQPEALAGSLASEGALREIAA